MHDHHTTRKGFGPFEWITIALAVVAGTLLLGNHLKHFDHDGHASHGDAVAHVEGDGHDGHAAPASDDPHHDHAHDDHGAHAGHGGHEAHSAHDADAAHDAHGGHGHHEAPPFWGLGILPFVALLGCIACLPLAPATEHWWESNKNRLAVALVLAGITLLYFGVAAGWTELPVVLDHAIAAEYVPFIMLLFSLYVISGGIRLTGDLKAHPITNAGFLGFGALIASFVGTTGASMLLIRPLLQTNQERKHVVHTVVFFIFLVSNIGGCLLPIGDPPLFLGFLKGVPFFWTMGLWPMWLLTNAILLAVYFAWDTVMYRREDAKDIQRDETETEPLRLTGLVNFWWLAGIVAAAAFIVPGKPFPVLGFTTFPFLREMVMLALTVASLLTTPRGVREANQFNYTAIGEVAALFVGIFITMQVPLAVLGANGASISEIMNQPWQYFWATGALSSFLDNAPTYVVFFELAGTLPENGGAMVALETGGAISAPMLVAISLGAVFMGAMTYIGNGPNFMVKAIAEQSGIKMPSFFGYFLRYAIPVLLPIFLLVMLIFLI